jgi:hypothetical protein
MLEFISTFGASDIAGVLAPQWYETLTIGMAHILLGMAIAWRRFPVWFAPWAFGGWLGKEIYADMMQAGFTNAVIIDSGIDLALGALGFLIWRGRTAMGELGSIGAGFQQEFLALSGGRTEHVNADETSRVVRLKASAAQFAHEMHFIRIGVSDLLGGGPGDIAEHHLSVTIVGDAEYRDGVFVVGVASFAVQSDPRICRVGIFDEFPGIASRLIGSCEGDVGEVRQQNKIVVSGPSSPVEVDGFPCGFIVLAIIQRGVSFIHGDGLISLGFLTLSVGVTDFLVPSRVVRRIKCFGASLFLLLSFVSAENNANNSADHKQDHDCNDGPYTNAHWRFPSFKCNYNGTMPHCESSIDLRVGRRVLQPDEVAA